MPKKGEIIKITIENHAFGGKGIGRIDDEKTIVFIKDGIPGQIVNARITKKKTKLCRGFNRRSIAKIFAAN